MQTFAKKKIALAVGASLLVMAGAAQAVAPAAPIARVAKPVLATPASVPNATALYGATGFTGTLPVKFNLVAPADTTSPTIAFAVLSAGADGLKVNAANNAATTVGAAVATDDIAVYAGTAGATQINLVVPTASQLFNANANTASAASVDFNIVTAGNEALRLNPTTGALEYTADKTAATIAWLAVNVAVQQPSATNAILATDSTGAPNTTPIAAIAGQSVFNTVAPTATAKTRATGALVDGVVIDTVTPLAAAIVVGSATTGVAFSSNVAACSPTVGDVNNPADIAAAAPVAPATGLTSAIAGSLNTLTFAGATTDWTTGAAAVDAAAYVSDCFNTGIANGSLPFNLAVTATPANLPTYSLVYNAAGANQVLAAIPTITDGAAPTVTSAQYTGNNLLLTFSEAMDSIGGGNNVVANAAGYDDLREVAENVLLGTTTTDRVSLAALALNSGVGISASLADNADGTSTLTVVGNSGITLAGKKATVTSGIAFKEVNDTGYSATVAALDSGSGSEVEPTTGGVTVQNSGGLKSTTGVTEAATITDLALTAVPVGPVAFTANTCSAQAAGDGSVVDSITCSFPVGSEIQFNTGKAAADLAPQLRIGVVGTNAANEPSEFFFFPTAAQVALNANGDLLTLTLPTSLKYGNIVQTHGMSVEYLNNASANVLTNKGDTTKVVTAGTEAVKMPLPLLVAGTLTNTLYTQSIKGTISNVGNRSLVKAYVAKYLEGATLDTYVRLGLNIDATAAGGATEATAVAAGTKAPAAVDFTTAKVSSAGDKVATDVALVIDKADNAKTVTKQGTTSSGANTWQKQTASSYDVLADLVSAQLNADLNKDAVKSIPVYIKFARSNDQVKGGANNQDQLNAQATLTTYHPGNSGSYTVYECLLDPKTGKISGRLNGDITISKTRNALLPRGLAFMGADGKFSATPSVRGEALTTTVGGAFNLLLGADAKSDLSAFVANTKDAFVLLSVQNSTDGKVKLVTGTDVGATNFVPFEATLSNLKGERTAFSVDAAKVHTIDMNNGTAWQLLSFKNPDRKAPLDAKATPRLFIGLTDQTSTGLPASFWTDGVNNDMALSMLGNATGFAAEGKTGDTVSTLAGKFKADAMALAMANDAADGYLFPLIKADSTLTTAPVGWSLISVPTAWATTLPSGVDAIINVGSQAGTSQYTWIKATDGTAPTLTAGQPVFIYSKAGVK